MNEMYSPGQPVICEYVEESIIGHIIKIRQDGYYEIQWCDGEWDMYQEGVISLFVKSYDSMKESLR